MAMEQIAKYNLINNKEVILMFVVILSLSDIHLFNNNGFSLKMEVVCILFISYKLKYN